MSQDSFDVFMPLEPFTEHGVDCALTFSSVISKNADFLDFPEQGPVFS